MGRLKVDARGSGHDGSGAALKIDRAIYAVNESAKTYTFLSRNLRWRELDAAENERNKRHLDGYTRIFPNGTRTVFHYRPPYTTRSSEHSHAARSS